MPRKRRPTPPPPGSIPPRQIAPKPEPGQQSQREDSGDQQTVGQRSSSSRQSTAGSDVELNNCGVPQCSIPNCRLPTHLNYGRQRRLALLNGRIHRGASRSPGSSLTEATSALTLNPDMDGRVKLPLQDTPDMDYARLFTKFFTDDFDRLQLIYRPQRKDPSFKQVSYRLALQNPTYCLTIIAQSHMGTIKDIAGALDRPYDSLTDLIYSQLLQMTRERLESFDVGDVDVLLLAIVVLCEYDLRLDRYDALRSHHIGMTALVSKRGGIYNLGLSLPYVLRMDRFLAVRAAEAPQFASPELPTTGVITHHPPNSTVSGAALRNGPSSLSEEVQGLCADAAQLLDLMDELTVTFEPSRVREYVDPRMEYFYFLRENVEVRHAILNHQHCQSAQSVNKDLLALTAMKIVQYYVCNANYLPVVTDLLSIRLWNLLTKPTLPANRSPLSSPELERSSGDPSYIPTIDLANWSDDMPMLLWILFACAIPSLREIRSSFAGRLASSSSSPGGGSQHGSVQSAQHSAGPRTASRGRSGQAILSPSSPRRHRYLPNFILHVAEHLVGERPLSGTADWDNEITTILEGFVWAGRRLDPEFKRVIGRVHENVLARAEEDA